MECRTFLHGQHWLFVCLFVCLFVGRLVGIFAAVVHLLNLQCLDTFCY